MKARLLATIAALLPLPALAQPAADTVLTGGQIHLLDAADRVVPALAVRDGRVVYVGADAGAKALIGPGMTTPPARSMTCVLGPTSAFAPASAPT